MRVELPTERSRCVPIRSKQSRGRRGTKRGRTRSFVRTVKAAARRKYTSEEKIRIVLEGFLREVHSQRPVPAGGDQAPLLLLVDKEFMEAGKERLTRDSVRDATQHEVGQLKRENGKIKVDPLLRQHEG